MKSIRKFVVLLCLLSPLESSVVQADMIPPTPPTPEKPEGLQKHSEIGIPIYSVVSGIVAVTLIVSLVALRRIRKRDDH